VFRAAWTLGGLDLPRIVEPPVDEKASRGDRRRPDVADRQSGNGRPQRVIRREDTVVPMSVFSWRRDQVREAIEKLMR
jgi:hypothetical protein